MHGRGVNFCQFFRGVNHFFGQGVDTAVNFGQIVISGFFIGRNFLVDGQDDNFIIGQEIFINGVAEIEPEEFFAVNFGVVHAPKRNIIDSRFRFSVGVVKARRCCHVQAFFAVNEVFVVNCSELR